MRTRYSVAYISYPCTETDAYDPGMDLRVRARVLCCWGHGTAGLLLQAARCYDITPNTISALYLLMACRCFL
jgi:hypothetical protein